jgi:hypothetical protein
VKITFEGKTIGEVLDQMGDLLAAVRVQGPGPDVLQPSEVIASPPVEHPVEHPVGKPEAKPPIKKERTEKQKANDERLRILAQDKLAAKRAKGVLAPAPVDKPQVAEKKKPEPQEADPFTASEVDPAKIVAIRQKTIEDLQSAYANGHQAEVFELLSKFGNGAKSFRELPPEAFMPIREAIDKGALT